MNKSFTPADVKRYLLRSPDIHRVTPNEYGSNDFHFNHPLNLRDGVFHDIAEHIRNHHGDLVLGDDYFNPYNEVTGDFNRVHALIYDGGAFSPIKGHNDDEIVGIRHYDSSKTPAIPLNSHGYLDLKNHDWVRHVAAGLSNHRDLLHHTRHVRDTNAIPDDEDDALGSFLEGGSTHINNRARHGHLDDEIKSLDSYIGRHHSPHAMTVFRGVSPHNESPDPGSKRQTYKPGGDYLNKAYTSTSIYPTVTSGFMRDGGHLLQLKVPKHHHGAFIPGKEGEFILPRNTLFHVDAAEDMETPTGKRVKHVMARLLPRKDR